MKSLFFLSLISFIIVSCNKYDMPRVGEYRSYGTISFTNVNDNQTTTTVGAKDNFKTLKVTSVQCAPSGESMITCISSSNGFEGAEYRGIQLFILGSFDDFPLENPNVNITLNKGKEFLGYTSTAVENVPITFSQFIINVPAKDRKIRASIPELIIDGDTLQGFEIDIQSFGGSPLVRGMTFDANGKACGSYATPLFNCVKAQSNEPGVNQIRGSFTPDSRNPIVDLKLDFVHHSSKLAYTGPVGKYDLSDGTGYTEIKITAEDQNGKIYREQKGKGFVRTIFEKPWYSYFNGSDIIYSEGYIIIEFEAELKSDDGTILTITNGNANYITRWS